MAYPIDAVMHVLRGQNIGEGWISVVDDLTLRENKPKGAVLDAYIDAGFQDELLRKLSDDTKWPNGSHQRGTEGFTVSTILG